MLNDECGMLNEGSKAIYVHSAISIPNSALFFHRTVVSYRTPSGTGTGTLTVTP